MCKHRLIIFLVIFSSFSFADAVSENDNIRSKNKKRTEKDDTYWNDNDSRTGVSSDGVEIVHSLPSLLLGPEKVGSTLYCSFFPSDISSGALVSSAYANGSENQFENWWS